MYCQLDALLCSGLRRGLRSSDRDVRIGGHEDFLSGSSHRFRSRGLRVVDGREAPKSWPKGGRERRSPKAQASGGIEGLTAVKAKKVRKY